MTKLILAIYDKFSQHRWIATMVLIVAVVVSMLLGMRLKYGENIKDFLPRTQENGKYTDIYNQLGDQGNTTIIFRKTKDAADDDVKDAMDLFEEKWEESWGEGNAEGDKVSLNCRMGDGETMEVWDLVNDNIALHLTAKDYERIEKMLSQEGFVENSLKSVKEKLAYPMTAMAIETMSADPLGLFTPALQRLGDLQVGDKFSSDEGYVVDDAGNGYAFMTTGWESSDTRKYGLLAKKIDSVATEVEEVVQGVKVSAVGAGLIAATNASQIKRDSVLGLIISAVLIIAILLVAMGRKRNILWLVASVVVGWLFALGVIAIVKPGLSVIVIGIGSVLIGIAVNYPLHYLDHIRTHKDKRESLKEMIEPLVTGNVTTVSAFACLVFVKAEAMRDLGLFGALMLVGTIVFVMVWLPLYAKSGVRKESQVEDEKESRISRKWYQSPLWLVAICLLTILFGWLSTKTEFDADLHNINYMTKQQKEDLRLLGDGDTTVGNMVYLVAEGDKLNSALRNNEHMMKNCRRIEAEVQMSGVEGVLLSDKEQDAALTRWEEFVSRHIGLVAEVRKEGARLGFSEEAFAPFERRMAKKYNRYADDDIELLKKACKGHVLETENGQAIVTFVKVADKKRIELKEKIKEAQCEGCYAFDVSDVGSNLVVALQDDFNYILYVCGFVVFFFLWLSMGRIELAMLSFIPLTVGWIWILGIMDIAGVKFNIVNIILATFIFGQGDDYTIFITEGLMYENAYGKKRLKSYRRSVVISALLMFVGIGVLVLAKHPAMRSLGEVAIIGMVTVILMACYLPPVIYRWLTMKGGKRRKVPITLSRLILTVATLAVYGIVALLVVTPMTCVYRLFVGKGDKARAYYHDRLCKLMKVAMKVLPRVKTVVENPCGEDFVKPAIIVANHQSHLDLPAVMMLNPKMVILTNDWVWRNPLYGVVIRYAQFYPSSLGYNRLKPHLQDLVSKGYSVMIFPEGTRSKDGTIGRMHSGAFMLAQELGIDILPIYIHGTGHVMPKDDILLREGSLTIHIGERIEGTMVKSRTPRELSHMVRRQFEEKICEMSTRLETTQYMLPYVRYQYIYKGRTIERRCKRALKAWRGAEDPFELGQGEVALTLALSHRDREYHYTFDNEDDYLVAKNVAIMPPNLHYDLRKDDKNE